MSDVRASLVAVGCLLRGVPLFFCAAPKTPLRVLCVLALDTVHALRHARPLPWRRLCELATFLDFQACTNAAVDHKDLCEAEYRAIRQWLEEAGLGAWVEAYLGRLRELEGRRPPIGGDHRRFDEVRSYREAVARLSFATVTGIALDAECLEEAIRATHGDGDLEALCRIAMQCQIIDDALDYAEDLAAGLPSFLTASASLPHAMAWTAEAARSYGAVRGSSSGRAAWPVRMALRAVTAATSLSVLVAHRRLGPA
jgi:hypothetical protein